MISFKITTKKAQVKAEVIKRKPLFNCDRMTGLEEENTILRAENDQLRQELKERDQFIALLSSQLTNLQLMQRESGIYSISDIPSAASNDRSLSRHGVGEEVPSSPHPLDPPRRSLEVSQYADGVFKPSMKTRLDSRIVEEGEGEDEDRNGDIVEKYKKSKAIKEESRGGNRDEGDPPKARDNEKAKAFKSAKGAIKALPRELSIINSDSDDVTIYSLSSGIFRLVKSDMRDAYNARGLYTGEVSRKQHLPHGFGRMDYKLQNRFYEGDWNMGHWHGCGTIRNAFGDIYRGQVVNDLREGNGRLEYADGRTFEGLFTSDDAVKGTLSFPDGAKYVGELNDGKRHGVGIYYFAGV